MQTLCLTIIIPFPPILASELINSAAAVTERFIDNSSGASVSACMRVCVCVCVSAFVQLCVAACTHVASGSNISSNLWFISLPAHSIAIYTWSLGHLFFFFLSSSLVFCPSTYWVLQTPVSEVWALWMPSEPWHRSPPPFLRSEWRHPPWWLAPGSHWITCTTRVNITNIIIIPGK